MKQIVIDYDEYLELEKAKGQIDSIKKELNDGAFIKKRRYDPVVGETTIKTDIVLTSGLQLVLEEIGNETSKRFN